MKLALICALALATCPAIATAASPDEADPAITVSYGDLDLGRHHDAKVLLGRIDDAAMQVCGADAHNNSAEWFRVRRSACFAETMAKAVAQIDAPALSAAFEAGGPFAVAER